VALGYHWTLLASPAGSGGGLTGSSGARPVLAVDRPGSYRLRLTVTERGRLGAGRAAAANVAGAAATDETVTASPASVLIPFTGLTYQSNYGTPVAGIKVGSTFYPNPTDNNTNYLQWLTLDRAKLTPIGTGNSWFDGSSDPNDPHGVAALAAALSHDTLGDLVIFAHSPYGPNPAVPPSQVDAFNEAMAQIGVPTISASLLTNGRKLAIVGIPYGGADSGYYTSGGSATDPTDALAGWLMPDPAPQPGTDALQYRLQPERPAFDTSSSSTATTNTMTIRSQSVQASLPAGATGGFQVVLIDSHDFTAVDQATFATNGVDPTAGLDAMGQYLNTNAPARDYVAVQSIGAIALPDCNPPAGHPNYPVSQACQNWGIVAKALSTNYGADPDYFNRANGSYAFLGGAALARSDDAQTTPAIPDSPTRGARKLAGLGRMRSDGHFVPVLSDGTSPVGNSLYGIAFRAPTPWMYTQGPDAGAYAIALAYITQNLPGLAGFAPDLRQSYVGSGTMSYAGSKTDLDNLAYPGDGTKCTDPAGTPAKDPGFTRAEFCNLSTELQTEFDWLDEVKAFFDAAKSALALSSSQQGVDLKTIGDTLRKDVASPNISFVSPLLKFIGALISIGGAIAGNPLISAGVGFITSAVDLGMAINSSVGGQPLSDQIKTKVDDLSTDVTSRYVSSVNTLQSLRQVIDSDPGSLQAMVTAIGAKPNYVSINEAIQSTLNEGARQYFATELLPIAYRITSLQRGDWAIAANTKTCGNGFILPWYYTPASAQVQIRAQFNPLYIVPTFTVLYVLEERDRYGYGFNPPAALTDKIFGAADQGNYGLSKLDYFWSHGPPTYEAVCS
jgi:hypothetical protein